MATTSQNERFFDLPLQVKDSLAYTSSKANRGYLSFGREQASLSTQVTLNGRGEEAGSTEAKQVERDQKCVPRPALAHCSQLTDHS